MQTDLHFCWIYDHLYSWWSCMRQSRSTGSGTPLFQLSFLNSLSSIHLIYNAYINGLFSSPMHTTHNLNPNGIQYCFRIKRLAFCYKMHWTFRSHYQYFDISESAVFILICIGSYNIWQQQYLNKGQKSDMADNYISDVVHIYNFWLLYWLTSGCGLLNGNKGIRKRAIIFHLQNNCPHPDVLIEASCLLYTLNSFKMCHLEIYIWKI